MSAANGPKWLEEQKNLAGVNAFIPLGDRFPTLKEARSTDEAESDALEDLELELESIRTRLTDDVENLIKDQIGSLREALKLASEAGLPARGKKAVLNAIGEMDRMRTTVRGRLNESLERALRTIED